MRKVQSHESGKLPTGQGFREEQSVAVLGVERRRRRIENCVLTLFCSENGRLPMGWGRCDLSKFEICQPTPSSLAVCSLDAPFTGNNSDVTRNGFGGWEGSNFRDKNEGGNVMKETESSRSRARAEDPHGIALGQS